MLAIFLLSIAGVCASDANDMAIASEDTTPIEMVQSDEISVNDNNQAIGQSNDEEIISEGNAGTFSELQNNITAMTGPTLELDRNYVYDDGFDTSGIKIDKKITIDGKGYTIDAQGKSRVFNIEASDVTIKNLTIKNANYDGYGGAVYFAQSGRAINCNFTNNKATGDDSVGGAIYMYSGTVENCNFTNNKATAFDSEGGAICMYSGTVTNCNFTNCSVTGEYSCGGAICFTSEGNVTNCNFVNNAASYGDAGAVYFSSGGAVTNCNFINNTATTISFDGTGGAIVFVGTATVTNCNFVNNTAFKAGAIYIFSGTVTNCNFTNNSAEYSGGAVFFMNYGNVENCNFTDNKATMGSAIYFYKEYSTDTLTISNSTFLNNRANVDDDTPLNVIINENNITITFMGQNNLLNAIYSCEDAEVTFNNVTYWGANGITTISSTNPESINEAGQNITVGVVVNDKLVLNDVKVTDENGAIVLDVKVDGDYYISVRHDEDSCIAILNHVGLSITFGLM